MKVEGSGYPKKIDGLHWNKLWNPLKAQKHQQLQKYHFYHSFFGISGISSWQSYSSLPFFLYGTEAHKAWNRRDRDRWLIFSLLQFPKCSEVSEKTVTLHLSLWWIKWGSDKNGWVLGCNYTLSYYFANFCHGRKFFMQQAFETKAKRNIFIIYSDLLFYIYIKHLWAKEIYFSGQEV